MKRPAGHVVVGGNGVARWLVWERYGAGMMVWVCRGGVAASRDQGYSLLATSKALVRQVLARAGLGPV